MNAKRRAQWLHKKLREMGFDSDYTVENVKAFLEKKGMSNEHVKIDGDLVDIKTVVVSFDPEVDDLEVMEVPSDPSGEAMDEDEKMDDDPEDEKADDDEDRRPKHRTPKPRVSKGAERYTTSVMAGNGPSSRGDRYKKMYDRKVKNRGVGTKQGQARFDDADMAELYFSFCRFAAMGERGYKHRDHDERVLSKAGTTLDHTAGGVLVPEELDPVVRDLTEEFGVARKLLPFVTMGSHTRTVTRVVNTTNDSSSNETGGIEASFVDENGAFTETDLNTGSFELISRKIGSLSRESSEILNDSFVNFADILADKHAQAHASKEDSVYFTGDGTASNGSIVGIINKMTTMGSNPEDAKGLFLASGDEWADITLPDILQLPAGLITAPGINPVWTCTPEFYYQVLVKFQHESERSQAIARSAADVSAAPAQTFLGKPVIFTTKMSSDSTATDSRDTVPLLYGDHTMASSAGEVSGSTELAQSDQRYFENDQIAFRMKRRIAMVPGHDVGTTTKAGAVVGLIMEDA